MENNEQFTNSIENAIHSFIMCVKDDNKNMVITQEMIYNEIISRVELDIDNECHQKEIVCDIINQIFNNKNEITMLELVNNFMGEQYNEENNVNNMKQITSGNGSAHKVNISELNLLDQDIPKELIHVHKPFENEYTTNNVKVLNNNYNYNKYDNATDIEYETLIKPSNNFGSLYCDNDNDDNDHNTNMQAELDVNEDDDNSNNNDNIEQCYNEEPIVYPINKKKNTFLYLSNDNANAPQSLNQSKDNERKYRKDGDFFMNMYQSVSYNNKKKLHLMNDKINKLYNTTYNDNNNAYKQPYYAMSLKHMGKTTTQHNNNHLYLNTPLTSMLQYKKPKTHHHHQYKQKLSLERDKLFNEVLSNAKKESAFISQRNIINNTNKYSNSYYMNINQSNTKQNSLNEIEERIVGLLARNRKVNVNERSIELKIAEQLKSMTDNISDHRYNDDNDTVNYVIDEHINILNINNNQQ